MRSALPLVALVALIVGVSVVLAGVASTVALGAPRGDHLDTLLDSQISADYSPDENTLPFAPLDLGLVDAAREDELALPEADGDIEFVPIFRVDPPEPPVFDVATPTPTASPEATDTTGPAPSITATPGSTPSFGPTATPPAGGEPTPPPVFGPPPPPTSSPKPGETPKPTPTPTPNPGASATPGQTTGPAPTPTPTPKPGETPKVTLPPAITPKDTTPPSPTKTPAPSSTPKPSDTQEPSPTSSTVPTPTPTPPPPTPTIGGILYLHNNPTPPIGHTTSQPLLPMDSQPPSLSSLKNYDTDRDSLSGIVIKKGGAGAGETDPDSYQAWRTPVLSEAYTLPNTMTATLWTAMKNFNPNKQGSMTLYLRDFNGGSYTTIAAIEVPKADWPGSSANWIEISANLTTASYTLAPGHLLEFKIIVNSQSDDSLWFAYDTTNYPSLLDLQ